MSDYKECLCFTCKHREIESLCSYGCVLEKKTNHFPTDCVYYEKGDLNYDFLETIEEKLEKKLEELIGGAK
jgi:hypothetical protein